jgi:hypothetical protein
VVSIFSPPDDIAQAQIVVSSGNSSSGRFDMTRNTVRRGCVGLSPTKYRDAVRYCNGQKNRRGEVRFSASLDLTCKRVFDLQRRDWHVRHGCSLKS